MMCLKFFWLWLPALLAVLILTSATTTTEDDDAAADYLVEVNQTFSHYANLEMEARWDYITDISKEHEEAMVRSIVEAIFYLTSLVKKSLFILFRCDFQKPHFWLK